MELLLELREVTFSLGIYQHVENPQGHKEDSHTDSDVGHQIFTEILYLDEQGQVGKIAEAEKDVESELS